MNIINILGLFLCLVLSTTLTGQMEKWQLTNSPKAPVYCFASIENYLYAGVGGVGVLRSDNKGESWDTLNNGLSSPYPSTILKTNGNTLYLSAYQGGVFESQDLGENWSPINEGLENLNVNDLIDKGNQLIAGTARGIYLWNKQERFWTKAPLPRSKAPNHYINCLFVQGNTILGGGTESLFFSTDGGKTWDVADGITKFNITDIEKKGSKLILATSGDGLLEITDNFRQWFKSLEFTGQEEGTYFNVLYPLNNDTLLKGSSYQGVLRGDKELNEGLEDLEIRAMIEHKGFLYVGTYYDGILIFDRDQLSLDGLTKDLDLRPNEAQLSLSVMPNPAKDVVTLSYTLEGGVMPVTLQILSEEGRLVKTVFAKELHSKGVYAKTVELPVLPPGIYFAVLTTDQNRLTKQFLLRN